MTIYVLAALFFLGDLILFHRWRVERRRHHKSRRALAFWRDAAQKGGTAGAILSLGDDDQAPRFDQAELDMIKAREELRRQVDARRRSPVRSSVPTARSARTGDAA